MVMSVRDREIREVESNRNTRVVWKHFRMRQMAGSKDVPLEREGGCSLGYGNMERRGQVGAMDTGLPWD